MRLKNLWLAFYRLFFSWVKFGGKNPHRMPDREIKKAQKKSKGGGHGKGLIVGLPKSSMYIANYFAKTGYSK